MNNAEDSGATRCNAAGRVSKPRQKEEKMFILQTYYFANGIEHLGFSREFDTREAAEQFTRDHMCGSRHTIMLRLPERVIARWKSEDWDEATMTASHYDYCDLETGEQLELTEQEADRYSWGQCEDNLAGGSQGGVLR